MVSQVRRPGYTRVSSKHQVTLPVEALRKAGISVGARLEVVVTEPGKVTLIRHPDALEEFAGMFTGYYPEDYLKKLRDEWD